MLGHSEKEDTWPPFLGKYEFCGPLGEVGASERNVLGKKKTFQVEEPTGRKM